MQCPNFLANSLLGGWIGCDDPMVLTAQQQMDSMRSMFGPAADPKLVDQAVNSFGQYLQNTGYDAKIASYQTQDAITNPVNVVSTAVGGWISNFMPAILMIGVIGIVAIGMGGPRRYGR